MIETLRHFIPELLGGFLVNVQIALGSLVVGLVVGLPLAMLRRLWPGGQRLVWSPVRLMQAAPVYVVMFFVLSVLPRDLALFGVPIAGLTAVILSQSVFMASYVAENGYRALEHLHRDERDLALLFLPNLLRGAVIVVMSSGFAAAIGVAEAVSVTMREAERLQSVPERLALFAVAIALFSTVFAGANALIRRLVHRLSPPKNLAMAPG